MFRKRAGPATVFAMLLTGAAAFAFASPAAAWPFASKPATPDPAKAAAAAAAAGPQKADADQRASAARQPPLVRATFWQHELQIDPSDIEAGLGLSAALRAMGKFDEAADAADRMAALYPKNEEALLESGRDHIAASRGFYALAPLRAAAKLAPKDWRPNSLLGIALEQDERPDDARTAYEEALKLSPDNPAVLTNLALYYAVRNDPSRAESLLRKAVAQPGATAQERQNLALILGLEGKAAEAEKWMREDLPPETTAQNLEYVNRIGVGPDGLRAALDASRPSALQASPLPASAPAHAADPPRALASGRTWGSVERSGANSP